MTLELGRTRDPADLIPADVGALHRAAALWKALALTADEVESTVNKGRTVSEWSGEAADAYGARVAKVASAWNAMAAAFRAGEAAVEELAAALTAARAKAGDAVDLWDQAEALDAAAFQKPLEPPSRFLGPDRRMLLGSGPRAEAQAVLADARASVILAAQNAAAMLRAAIAVPDLGADEWAAILTGCASPSQVLDALAGADAASLAALLRARPSLAAVLAQAEPSAVATWWAELGDSQKEALIHAAPAIIGSLGGVAYVARDEANRIWLEDRLAQAHAALREAEQPSFDDIAGGQAAADAYAERLDQARSCVKALEDIESALTSPDGGALRHLVTLTADSPPLAAVSIGDLDTADNVTYAVPGMGTTTEGMGGWARAAQNLVDQQDRVDPGRSHATVAWIGYKTPPIPIVQGGFEVMHNDLANAGASNLAKDLRSLDHVNPAAQVSVLAHSYGTTTASLALTRDDVHVDALVTLGSAGLPASIASATDMHAGSVFSGQAQDVWAIDPARGDQWAWTGRLAADHPINPVDPDFGSHSFSVAGDGILRAVTDHGAVTPDDGAILTSRRSRYATWPLRPPVTVIWYPLMSRRLRPRCRRRSSKEWRMASRTSRSSHFSVVGALVALSLVVLSGCAQSKEDRMTPAEARDALVTIIEDSAAKLDATGWHRDHAPEVGDCDGQQGQRANYNYGYGAPAPDGDRRADAQIIADYWTMLGMQVRVVDTPVYVVYASGGPVAGLSFSTAPGDYYIAGTSLCVPGDAAELRTQDNG